MKKIIVLFCFLLCFFYFAFCSCNNSYNKMTGTSTSVLNTLNNSDKKTISYYGFKDPLESLKRNNENLKKYEKLKKTIRLKNKTVVAYRDYKNGVEIIEQEDYCFDDLKPYEDAYIHVPAYIKGKPVIKIGGEFKDPDPVLEPNDNKYKYYYFVNCFEGSMSTKIYLPATVKEIIKGTFDIETLERIEVDKNNPYYSSKNGILYDKSGKIKLCVPPNHPSRNKD